MGCSMSFLKRDQHDRQGVDILVPALHNELILSNIFSFLPLKDLKKVVLVSPLWNAVASSYLTKRGQLSLYLFLDETIQPEFRKYTAVLKGCGKVDNLRMVIARPETHPASGAPPEPFFTRTSHFCRYHLHRNVKELDLFVEIKHAAEFQLFLDLIRRVSPTLEKLDFHIPNMDDCEDLNIGEFFVFPRDMTLPKLKVLVQELIYHTDYLPDEETLTSFYEGLFRAAPNIEMLEFTWFDEAIIFQLLGSERGRSLLPKFNRLKVNEYFEMEGNVEFAKRFPRPLRVLELDCSSSDPPGYPATEALIERCKGSLEILKLSELEGSQAIETFAFPRCMPKVRVLEMNFNNDQIQVKFGTNGFAKTFPEIQTLQLSLEGGLSSNTNWVKFFNRVFPEVANTKCYSLRKLILRKVPRSTGQDLVLECKKERTCPSLVTFREIFPNAELVIIN